MKGEIYARIKFAELRISEDILRQPEVLPLLLRNLVVVMTDNLDLPEERPVFKKYMKIAYELERAFKLRL